MALPLLAPILSGIGSIFSGGSKGAADERTLKNQFTTNANQAANQQYGTAQNALLSSLLAKSNEATSRYGTKQGATTSAMSGLQGATSRALEAQSQENLDRARLKLQTPGIYGKQAILGSLMASMQPHQFVSPAGQKGHLTQVSGGMTSALSNPAFRDMGNLLAKQAMEKQLAGGDDLPKTDFLSGIQDWKSSVLDVPEATDYSKALLKPPTLEGYKDAGKGESWLSGLGIGAGILGQLLPAIGNKGGGGGGGAEFSGPIEPMIQQQAAAIDPAVFTTRWG